MKSTIIFQIFFLIGSIQLLQGQSTDSEKLLRAQNTDSINGWKKGGIVVVNLSQTSLSNWAGGGENSLSLNGLLSTFANYKQKNFFWSNSLDIGYGILKQGKIGAMKTDDKIDFVSKYGRHAFKDWYYAVLFNFKTQMSPGYNYPNDSIKISDFLAPAYIITALGLEYHPDNYFSLYISPATSKITIVNNQTLANSGAFGVTPATYDNVGNLIIKGKESNSEFGGYIRMIYTKTDFKSEFMKNVAFTTKLDLFSNYLKNPQNIVVNWETLIALKVNKVLTVNLNTTLIYDDKIVITQKNADGSVSKIGPRLQFKELLGIGVSYKFNK